MSCAIRYKSPQCVHDIVNISFFLVKQDTSTNKKFIYDFGGHGRYIVLLGNLVSYQRLPKKGKIPNQHFNILFSLCHKILFCKSVVVPACIHFWQSHTYV